MALVNLEGVTVTVFRLSGSIEGREYIQVKSATTDVSGNWVINGLIGGSYYMLKYEDANGDYVITYFNTVGKSLTLTELTPFQLTADTLGINVVMYSGFKIGGNVQGESL